MKRGIDLQAPMSPILVSTERYQKNLTFGALFPKVDGRCACGCNNQLIGKRTKWYSDECRIQSLHHYYILKGDSKFIRAEVFRRDMGYCRSCGVFSIDWQADHILPVHKGGGACSLDNIQTLCIECHKAKTILDRCPYGDNIQAARLNMVHSCYNRPWALNKSILKDVIGYKILSPYGIGA